MNVNGYRQLSGYQHSSNYLLLCSAKVWNNLKTLLASKLKWFVTWCIQEDLDILNIIFDLNLDVTTW